MSERMDDTMPRRRRQRRRTGGEVPHDLSGALRDFKDHTDGLSNRLPLASLEAMRAGTVASPHTLLRRYLLSARGIGLPKEWAQRLVTWLQRQVDALWPMECTPLDEMRRRALRAEALANAAELNSLTLGNRECLLAEREALHRELAADTLLIARIDRELDAREAGR